MGIKKASSIRESLKYIKFKYYSSATTKVIACFAL